MQAASASADGFTPSAIILALGGVVTVLARGWQVRLKNSEVEARERTAQLIKNLEEGQAKEAARADRAEARATYLEDQRGHLATKLLEARLQAREYQRSQSPPPDKPTGPYSSTQTSATKIRPSRG